MDDAFMIRDAEASAVDRNRMIAPPFGRR